MIISVLNQKGGCGKTTISTNLAAAIHARGNSVVLVDTDEQGSASAWADSDTNPIALLSLPQVDSDLGKSLSNINSEFIVIDGSPRVDKKSVNTIKISDFVLIPVVPSAFDFWAVEKIFEKISAYREISNGKPDYAVVISISRKGSKLEETARKAFEVAGIPVLDTAIRNRAVYPQSAAKKQSVFQTPIWTAQVEMNLLLNEILKIVEEKN